MKSEKRRKEEVLKARKQTAMRWLVVAVTVAAGASWAVYLIR